MTIQQLRYFLALCQDLNYTRTAGRLYLSRQALRLSIAALENELCGHQCAQSPCPDRKGPALPGTGRAGGGAI